MCLIVTVTHAHVQSHVDSRSDSSVDLQVWIYKCILGSHIGQCHDYVHHK